MPENNKRKFTAIWLYDIMPQNRKRKINKVIKSKIAEYEIINYCMQLNEKQKERHHDHHDYF